MLAGALASFVSGLQHFYVFHLWSPWVMTVSRPCHEGEDRVNRRSDREAGYLGARQATARSQLTVHP